ncbi:hypothetical protein Barb7_02687 [Bacteroidales bacterium Barb7]|nr:hypothetical protein Barb7_02687 [Bacteroidales bacterium Barb7]
MRRTERRELLITSVYSPLMSVTTPLVVPLSRMLAPGIGSPSSSITFPLTVDWAKAAVKQKNINTASKQTLFFRFIQINFRLII